MSIELCPVRSEEKDVLNNLLEKYNYEFSQYDNIPFGPDGLFHYWPLDAYWTEEGRAAYFILADHALAGFVLINRHPEADHPLDWAIAEFFVAYPYRRKGVGSAAMAQVFQHHKGRWQIKYHTKNLPSVAFWNGLARRYATGPVEALRGLEDYCDGTPSTVLCFETK